MNYKKIADTIYEINKNDGIDNITVTLIEGQIVEFFPRAAPTDRWIRSINCKGKLRTFHYIGSENGVQNFLCKETSKIYAKSKSVFSIYSRAEAQQYYRNLHAEAIAKLTMPTHD